ncbi:MAG: GTP pyrophosphokinase [Parcubacteria group bacterium Gr01-1014_48]|nr:MAG: GTP pyrophosphokinase [Parcubacteria group bacterium Greene0416_14]TSC74544.1 MAG: GTP pyrophosphokinase [Parcubacteria group bacterium Gr01-1014_48]TSD01420.1 MAG: GTP pyrophosphokinase [Parcubacteria group bacterium Greene1014_15]TSD08438.1 MAG: GTP pyrophosphokinase [Parcubacteria group bacterium Greene0714_4]
MADTEISVQDKIKEITSLRAAPFSKEGMMLMTRAYLFALNAHKNHTRYSGEPYMVHLHETAKNLAKLGMGSHTIAAGLLHDVIEDTGIDQKIIQAEFGNEILGLIEGVTKLGTLKYRGLKRHTESLRKLFIAMSKDLRVLIIKLADRLHNMQTLMHVPLHKQKRIAEETLEIFAPLAYRLGMRSLNRELEDLAFPYVYPKEHAEIKKMLKQKSKETGVHLEKNLRSLQKALAKENVRNTHISFRIKGLYSTYKKWLRKNKDINQIYDISAIRIVVPSIHDCYHVLGIIHGLWRPMPGRIKDYIAFPKPNGYQSIHTTIFTGDGSIIEVQIRTEDMERDAEFGIASHLIYKEGRPADETSNFVRLMQLLSYRTWFSGEKSDSQSGATPHAPDASTPLWVQQLAESQAEITEPQEFLENLRADFFQHRVFVFTPMGDVVDLPVDSSPIDFAYAIHSDIGNHISGAKVNGKLVSLDTKLHNGDVVEIQTKQSSKPSSKWLEFCKTGVAKRKIQASLQPQDQNHSA